MASNILTTNTGPIDWSKRPSATPASRTARSQPPRSNPQAFITTAKYRKQTFEDRPTIFGDMLRISWSITDFELAASADSIGSLNNRYRQINADKLKHHISGACPDCLSCAHLKVTEQQDYNVMLSENRYSLTAKCELSKKEGIMIRCPNGQFAVRKGYTALAPNIEAHIAPQITEIPATEVHRQESQPYIRSQERDRPTSAAHDAW